MQICSKRIVLYYWNWWPFTHIWSLTLWIRWMCLRVQRKSNDITCDKLGFTLQLQQNGLSVVDFHILILFNSKVNKSSDGIKLLCRLTTYIIYGHVLLVQTISKRSNLSYLMAIIFYGYDYESICVLCALCRSLSGLPFESHSASVTVFRIVLFVILTGKMCIVNTT